MTAVAHRLEWAESFWKGIKPWVYLRSEDRVLILPPNRVYKLNETGYRVLEHLSSGGRISSIAGSSMERANEIQAFFDSLRRVYDGEAVDLDRRPFDFDFTRLPVLGEIAITYRCNHRCRFCYAGCGTGKPALDGEELDTAGFRKVIDIFRARAQIPFFSFTGGEPLIRKDLEALVRHARKRGLRTNLITNGTLIDLPRAKALKRAGLSSVQVSVEGPDAETHEGLTMIKGSFDRVLAGIKAFQDAGIPVQTNTTIARSNAEKARLMPGFLRSLGVMRFSMNLFIPVGSGAENGDLFLPYAEIGPIVDEVRKIAFREGMTFLWYSPTPFCLYNPIARGMGNKSCAAMDGLISVTPSGDVIPCSSWAEPMGNLLKDDFSEIWFSGRAAHIKNKRYAPAACQDCDAFTACQAACPLYWAWAGTAEIEGRAIHRQAAPLEEPAWT